jgi:ring-1,2-phenylacetyl-CoA epoxidase subunit PaaD
MVTEEKIWQILEQVSDPEIPVLTIADLGIIRGIEKIDDSFKITITPTYSGCPAMRVIESEIEAALANEGITNITIETILSPAWTTDWLSENGRRKLAEYGIAPPVDEPDKSILFADAPKVSCPKCHSSNTKMVSLFGSTACKAHYQCNACFEPFDYFKCLK